MFNAYKESTSLARSHGLAAYNVFPPTSFQTDGSVIIVMVKDYVGKSDHLSEGVHKMLSEASLRGVDIATNIFS